MLTDEYPFNAGPGRERTPVEVSLAFQMEPTRLMHCGPAGGPGYRIYFWHDERGIQNDARDRVDTKSPVWTHEQANALIASANAAVERIGREVAR